MDTLDLKIADLRSTQQTSEIEFEEKREKFVSSFFAEKEEVLKNLLETQSPDVPPLLPKADTWHLGNENIVNLSARGNVLHAWKNIENISARLIDTYGKVVLLECLLDKEQGIYEEREFSKMQFEGYELVAGNLFYLRFFVRAHEVRMEVHNDPGLVLSDDFPTIDYRAVFKKSKLFNKR